jgi:hypothetical protein
MSRAPVRTRSAGVLRLARLRPAGTLRWQPAIPRVLQVALSLNPGGTERLVVQLATRLHRGRPDGWVVQSRPSRSAWGRQKFECRGPSRSTHSGRTPGASISSLRGPPNPPVRRAAHRATVDSRDAFTTPAVRPIAASAALLWTAMEVGVVFTEHGTLGRLAALAEATARQPLAGDVFPRYRVARPPPNSARTWWQKGFRNPGVEVVQQRHRHWGRGPLPERLPTVARSGPRSERMTMRSVVGSVARARSGSGQRPRIVAAQDRFVPSPGGRARR